MLTVLKVLPYSAAAVMRTVAAAAVVFSLASCGGGSAESAAGGAQLHAAATVVAPLPPAAAPGVARRITPFDPVVNSANPAMRKLAKMECAKRAKYAPGLTKFPYSPASRQSLRQDNCALIMPG
jgi:hypothetical protein